MDRVVSRGASTEDLIIHSVFTTYLFISLISYSFFFVLFLKNEKNTVDEGALSLLVHNS